MLYYVGRTFQLIGLIAMPYSFWVTEFDRDEGLAVGIFLGSILVFFIGWLLTRFSRRTS